MEPTSVMGGHPHERAVKDCMNSPYLSFVLGSRNDDYADTMLLRLQTTLEVFVAQLEEHRLDAEIIVVEWNPPPNRPLLAEALHFPASTAHVTVRIVTVDPALHRTYLHWDIKPIHVGVVYNVGVRRARGHFVAHKASDVFYSRSLMECLAKKSLSEEHVYRCDRFDVDADILTQGHTGATAILDNIDTHIVRHHARLEVPEYFDIRDLHTNACGDFTLMAKHWWHAIRGRHESRSVLTADLDSLVLHGVCATGALEQELPPDCRVYKIAHSSLFVLNIEQEWNPVLTALEDFLSKRCTLRTKNRVRSILNYPKRKMRGRKGIQLDSFEKNFLSRAQKWARGEGPFYLNSLDWGLADVRLPEHRVCRAQWDEESDLDRLHEQRRAEDRETDYRPDPKGPAGREGTD